jgi:hypothetical protein
LLRSAGQASFADWAGVGQSVSDGETRSTLLIRFSRRRP